MGQGGKGKAWGKGQRARGIRGQGKAGEVAGGRGELGSGRGRGGFGRWGGGGGRSGGAGRVRILIPATAKAGSIAARPAGARRIA